MIALGARRIAIGRFLSAVRRTFSFGSWHPLHTSRSPGCRYVSLRMFCTAQPSARSAWKKSGTPTGARKYALPSASTGTVPRHWRPVWRASAPSHGRCCRGLVFGKSCHTRKAVIASFVGNGMRAS